MAFTKTLRELKRAIELVHNSSDPGWYGLLIDGEQSEFTFTTTGSLLTCPGHNFVNGCRVTLFNVGGSLPQGLSMGTQYRIINVNVNKFNLTSIADYNHGVKTGTPINILSAGSGVHRIIEEPLSALDDLDIWVRHEVYYAGSGRQELLMLPPAVNWQNGVVTVGPINSIFVPTETSISFRYYAVISGGNPDSGDTTGHLVGFEDYILGETILPGDINTPGSGKTFQYTARYA